MERKSKLIPSLTSEATKNWHRDNSNLPNSYCKHPPRYHSISWIHWQNKKKTIQHSPLSYSYPVKNKHYKNLRCLSFFETLNSTRPVPLWFLLLGEINLTGRHIIQETYLFRYILVYIRSLLTPASLPQPSPSSWGPKTRPPARRRSGWMVTASR